MLRNPRRVASLSLRTVENLGLLVIAIATVIAGIQGVNVMIAAARVTLADLLLMFIYLEVLTMVGLYFESGKLPVRIPRTSAWWRWRATLSST